MISRTGLRLEGKSALQYYVLQYAAATFAVANVLQDFIIGHKHSTRMQVCQQQGCRSAHFQDGCAPAVSGTNIITS